MTKYAITHINRDGVRQLSWANQGRLHLDRHEDAERKLVDWIKHNSPDTLRQVFGPQALGTFEIRPMDCYDHGDAKGIYFDTVTLPKPGSRPIAYELDGHGTVVHSGCWNQFDQIYRAENKSPAPIGTLFYGPDLRLEGRRCPVCQKSIVCIVSKQSVNS